MPLWIIYHPSSTFTNESTKLALAQAITKHYTVLPGFYVNVLFQPIAPSSLYISGVARPSPHTAANEPGPDSSVPFIRITIEHIARTLPNKQVRDRFLHGIDAILKPFIADKGYDWEYSIDETSRDLWKINGHVPPMPDSEAEREWKRVNRAVPFENVKGGLEEA